jgi:hypothetical protein
MRLSGDVLDKHAVVLMSILTRPLCFYLQRAFEIWNATKLVPMAPLPCRLDMEATRTMIANPMDTKVWEMRTNTTCTGMYC